MDDDFAKRVEARYQVKLNEREEAMERQGVDAATRDRLMLRFRRCDRDQAERTERYIAEGKPQRPDPLPPGEYRTTMEVRITLGRDSDEPNWLYYPYTMPDPSEDEEAEFRDAERLVCVPAGTVATIEGVHKETARSKDDGTLCRYFPSIAFGDGHVYDLTCDWDDEELKKAFEWIRGLKPMQDRVGRRYRHKTSGDVVVVVNSVGVGRITHTVVVVEVGRSHHKLDTEIEVAEWVVSFPWDHHWEEVDGNAPDAAS